MIRNPYHYSGSPLSGLMNCKKDALELTIAERIWRLIMDTVIDIANVFGLTDDEVMEAVFCRSDEFAHICRTFNLKAA